MKQFLVFLLTLVQLCAPAYAQMVQGKGQADSSFSKLERLQVPNSQLTSLGTNSTLVETGNNNLLANPSFEHITPTTGWTLGTGVTAAADAISFIDGKKSLGLTLTSVNGDVIKQSLTPTMQTTGLNLEHGLAVKTSLSTLQVCATQGATEFSCTTVPNTNTWFPISIPLAGPTSGTAIGVKLKTTSSTSGSVSVDAGYMGLPRNTTQVPAVTDWQSFTPTGSWGSTTYTGLWRRVGDSIEVKIDGTLTGTPSGNLTVNLPSNVPAMDSNKIFAGHAEVLGFGGILKSGSRRYDIQAVYNSSTQVTIQDLDDTASNQVTATSPAAFASGDNFNIYFKALSKAGPRLKQRSISTRAVLIRIGQVTRQR